MRYWLSGHHHKAAAFLLFLTSLCLGSALATECPKSKDAPPLSISVEFIDSEPTYNINKSIAEIKILSQSALTPNSNHGQTILGLTSTELNNYRLMPVGSCSLR
jgi:hypothetical protein